MNQSTQLALNPAVHYDAFVRPAPADDDDRGVAIGGVVGFVEFYPEHAGLQEDGTFDGEAWEAARHSQVMSFRPTRQGYRSAMVAIKQQPARVTVVDLADDYGYHQFEDYCRTLRRAQ